MDAHNTTVFLEQSATEKLEQDKGYLLAVEIASHYQTCYSFCRETPRWESLWDQVSRASSSVALNYAQAWGKGRGYFANDMWVARGEAYEVLACIAIGPAIFREPKAKVLELIQVIDKHIKDNPKQEKESNWGHRRNN